MTVFTSIISIAGLNEEICAQVMKVIHCMQEPIVDLTCNISIPSRGGSHLTNHQRSKSKCLGLPKAKTHKYKRKAIINYQYFSFLSQTRKRKRIKAKRKLNRRKIKCSQRRRQVYLVTNIKMTVIVPTHSLVEQKLGEFILKAY